MPTFAEQIAAANAKLDSLVAAAVVVPEEKTVKLTPQEALVQISDELAAETVTKQRATYLRTKLAELAKSNFEQTTTVEIKVMVDPLQQKTTHEEVSLQSLTTGTPDASGFASNLSSVGKAQLIQKLLLDPVALKKSAVSDKLEQIKAMFQISDDDLKTDYDLSWKVGDLIRLLMNAVKLENLVGAAVAGAPAPATTTATAPAMGGAAPAAFGKAGDPTVWPHDMAKAKFDPVKKAYEPEKNVWNDKA